MSIPCRQSAARSRDVRWIASWTGLCALLLGASCEVRRVPATTAAAGGRDWYVAAASSSGGDGSVANPFGLAAALSHRQIRAGDRVWLRGGVYEGAFVSELTGTPQHPIVVRPYSAERVILDGIGIEDRWKDRHVLTIRGADAHFWNLEVRDSTTTRAYPDRSTPPRPIGISVYGQRIKVINSIVHNAGNGIGLWNAGDSEVYGALIFNNGYMDPNPNGHGLYIQNDDSQTTTHVTNSIAFNNFQMGMHAYGEGGTINGLTIDQFVTFNNGSPPNEGTPRRDANLFIGPRSKPADRIVVTRSHSYHPSGVAGIGVRLGYTAANRRLEARDNYFIGGTQPVLMTNWEATTFEGNTVFAPLRAPDVKAHETLLLLEQFTRGPYVWHKNSYYDQSTPENGIERRAFGLEPAPSGYGRTYAEWQATAGDWGSRYHEDRPPDQTFVLSNKYERGRAHVVVYNWSRQPSATISLRDIGLRSGQCYEVRDVQNFFGPLVASGRYVFGTPLRLPLTAHAVAGPLGWKAAVRSTAPDFNVFIVIPKSVDAASDAASGTTCPASAGAEEPLRG